jgi:hypothetical protein
MNQKLKQYILTLHPQHGVPADALRVVSSRLLLAALSVCTSYSVLEVYTSPDEL